VAFIRENSFVQPDGQPNNAGNGIIYEDLVDEDNEEINLENPGLANGGSEGN
jgi:hypothetical protein